MVTSFVFFMIGGLMALIMRAASAAGAAVPIARAVQPTVLHGTIMLLFFATPRSSANYLVPLQIGAPDVSFPRLNAFAYWLYLFGGHDSDRGLHRPQAAPPIGWYAYAPAEHRDTRLASSATYGSSA